MLPALLAPCLGSCVWMKPAQKRLDENRAAISRGFLNELGRQSGGGGQETLQATWPQAMEKMYLSNPDLIQADNQIENARQQQKQLWRNLLPLVGVGVSDHFAIRDIGDAFSSPQLRIHSYLPLGGLLQMPKDAYTRKLFYMGAELQAEHTMRQQVIALYRLFQEQRLLEMEKRAIDLEGQLVGGLSDEDGFEILTMRARHREALDAWETNRRAWNMKVGDFFMGGYGHVNLVPNHLPDISYSLNDLDFSDTGRWGLLQLNLLALEQIAEDGRILEMYLRYFPTPNLSVSAPPLYSSNSTRSFAAESINLSPALNWSLDTQGSLREQFRRLRSDQTIKDWRKDKRQRDEVVRLLQGKQALADIRSELVSLRRAMDGFRKAVGSGLVRDPREAIQTMRKLREMEVRLAAREIEICSSFWLIDEQRWAPITKRWLQTRPARAKQRE